MRIGIDIRPTQFQNGLRGIGRYTYDLVKGLARYAPGNEYVLLASPDRPLPEGWQNLPDCCRVAPLPTRFMGEYSWRQSIRRVWRLRYLRHQRDHAAGLRQVVERERLDLVHLPSVIEPFFFAGGDVGCPVVKTLYDLVPLIFVADCLETWPEAQRYVYRRQLDSFHQADVVLAISASARQDAITHIGLTPEKVQVVSCAVPPQFTPMDDQARMDACLAAYNIRSPYFLFCSGGGSNKNRERIVRAFGAFRQRFDQPWPLVFVGPDDGDDVRNLKSIAWDIGLDRRDLLITGYVPDEDLVTLFAGAQGLVSPTLYEGFGLPAAQAMQAGVPVVAANTSSYPEVVGDAGILVDPYDVDAIAEALLRLARDPDLRAELGRRGQARAARFRLENQADALIQVYEQLMTRSKPATRPQAPLLVEAFRALR